MTFYEADGTTEAAAVSGNTSRIFTIFKFSRFSEKYVEKLRESVQNILKSP